MSNNAKVLRGQLRQITKEVLPEILSLELKSELFKSLQADLIGRLSKIEANVRETLEAIENRQKDTLGYLVRQVTANADATITETVPMPAVVETTKSE